MENESFDFRDWSGLVSSSENPITFRVLEDGTLIANLIESSSIPPEFYAIIISVVVFGVLSIFSIPLLVLLVDRYYVNRYRKKINSIFEKSGNNKETILQEINRLAREAKESFEKKRMAIFSIPLLVLLVVVVLPLSSELRLLVFCS